MTFSATQFHSEKTSYISPTWDEMQDLAFEIAKKMLKDGQKFDRLVTLAKGGWPMTRSLVDFLQISKVASVGVKFYGGINERLDQPQIYQDLPISVEGETVLLYDDVADTGESLEYIIQYLREKGVSKIITATLFYKPHSKVLPDYYGAETTDWIIFPHDVVETIELLGKKWLQAGIEKNEIVKRFKTLGFKSEVVQYYFTQETSNL